jgi:solute carrier family 25 phosphate transporter 3
VVKPRIQVDPVLKGQRLFSVGRKIVAGEGPGALFTGFFRPTAVGYLAQCGMKFAGDEYFKGMFIDAIGSHETAVEYRTAIYLGSATITEFFADVALCPLKATRTRLMSERGSAPGLVTAFLRILTEDSVAQCFYSGFIQILFKQVSPISAH